MPARVRPVNIFGASLAVANAVAPVQTVPTTTALFYLHNNAPAGGPALRPLQVGAFLASGTGAAGATLLGTITTASTVSPPSANGTGYTVSSFQGSNPSNALVVSSQTIPAGSAWVMLDARETTADTTPGTGLIGDDLEDLFVVPPGFGFCLAVLAGAGTTAKFCPSFIWQEA